MDWRERVLDELKNIRGKSSAKKRNTILRICEAQALGHPWGSVFKREDTCAEMTFYQYWRHETEPGGFMSVLNVCVEYVDRWLDEDMLRTVDNVKRARIKIQPKSLHTMIELLGHDSASIRFKAAAYLLDYRPFERDEKLEEARREIMAEQQRDAVNRILEVIRRYVPVDDHAEIKEIFANGNGLN